MEPGIIDLNGTLFASGVTVSLCHTDINSSSLIAIGVLGSQDRILFETIGLNYLEVKSLVFINFQNMVLGVYTR